MFGRIGLSISGLFFSFLIFLVYLSKKQYSDFGSNIFRFILEFSVFVGFFEIFAFVFDGLYYKTSPLLDNIFFRIYSILIMVVIVAVYLYLKERFVMKNGSVSDFFTHTGTLLFFFFAIIIFGASFFLKSSTFNLFRYGDGTSMNLIEYFGFDTCYTSVLLMFLLCVIAIIKFIIFDLKKNRSFQILFALYLFVLLGIAMTQTFFSAVYSLSFIVDISVVLLYLAIENQDKMLAQELDEARVTADIADKEKTAFLSKMSHEIRTPLNTIIGFSNDVLEKGKNKKCEEISENMRDVYSAGKNLLEVINNVLLFSSLESGNKGLEEEEYKLSEIFGELNSYSYAMLDNNVKFSIKVDKEMPNTFYGDKLKVYRVLVNLVSNGIKYTKDGEVVLSVSMENMSSGFGNLKFSVSDSGVGMEENSLDYLFSPVNDSSSHVSINGVGLGLTLAKKIVDLVDGKLSYKTTKGVGTTFTFEVVQRIVNYDKIGSLSFENYRSLDDFSYFDCSQYRILVADDNIVNMKVVERQLHYYNINYDFVNNGVEVMQKIKEGNKYDMIILDHMMPEMDGIQTFRNLKKKLKDDIPPVVIMTANIVTEVKDTYIKEGFTYFISKPIDLREFNVIMKNVFNKDETR